MLATHPHPQGPDGHLHCPACGMHASNRTNPRDPYGGTAWTEWRAPDGRTWLTCPGEAAPSCPPPPVEALCPWRDDAMRYAGAKGDVQLATAMATWCDTHQMAVSDCPDPGPYCPGVRAHEDDAEQGKCTGRWDTCRCMCPECCGDTPDVWGAPRY
jgi:hypothetical protein